jgi:RNA polymerase sigma-70 factor (ECF subfamily)
VPLEAARGAADAAARPDEELLRRERERLVRAAVLELPRRQREVLNLRVDAGLSFAEVSDVLGITENAAKVSFHHATRALRDALAREDRP